MTVVEVAPLEIRGTKCDHPRCDGRDAKWHVGKFVSCAVHVARFLEITLRNEPLDVLDGSLRAA